MQVVKGSGVITGLHWLPGRTRTCAIMNQEEYVVTEPTD